EFESAWKPVDPAKDWRDFCPDFSSALCIAVREKLPDSLEDTDRESSRPAVSTIKSIVNSFLRQAECLGEANPGAAGRAKALSDFLSNITSQPDPCSRIRSPLMRGRESFDVLEEGIL